MRMILLVLGIVVSFGVMGQPAFDEEAAYQRRMEMVKNIVELRQEMVEKRQEMVEKHQEILKLKQVIADLTINSLKTKESLQRQLDLTSKQYNSLKKEFKAQIYKANISEEEKETLTRNLDSVLQINDTISIRLQQFEQEHQQKLQELNKKHKANLDSIEIELLEQKTAYIKKMREIKSIELESVSLGEFLSTLKIEGILILLGSILGFLGLGYRFGLKYKENAFDKEKNTLHFENLTMKQELEVLRTSQKKKYY
ncbi:MAG: hypothetical protein AB8E82_06390 [Aureispira sp.]